MSAMVGPSIAAVAAESAVEVICNETSCSRDIFHYQDGLTPDIKSKRLNQIYLFIYPLHLLIMNVLNLTGALLYYRGVLDGDLEMKDAVTPSG